MLKKIACMVAMLVVMATMSTSFAATGYVENGCWNGDANYPVIAYYRQMYIEVVRRDSVHKQTTGVCADSVCISSMMVNLKLNDIQTEDAFFFKKIGLDVYFTTYNRAAGNPKSTWVLMDATNKKHSSAVNAYRIVAENMAKM